MKYLLDTNILLWWLNADKRLKENTRDIIQNPKNSIYISVASAWEISIKLNANPDFTLKTSVEEIFKISKFPIIDISLEHVLNLHKLPMLHKDPFDRVLIAQAITEKCTLITSDSKIRKYNVKVVG